MSATVVIPTVNGVRRLPRLLESLDLEAQQVLVVDNGSRDGTSNLLRTRFPAVDVLRLERNEGFSRAVNAAARRTDSLALVLLNDDCVCEPGFVPALAAALDPAAGIIMAASVLRRWHAEGEIESAGMEIDRTLLVWEHLHGEPLTVLNGEVEDPIGPSAAGAAFDRDAFLAVGGFDEHLFAYWEDVDLVLSLRREGGRCVLARNARGTHEHAATLGSGSPRKNYLMGFGRSYVLRKWGAARLRLLPAILARDLPICMGQLVVDRNASGIRGRLDGYRAADGGASLAYPADLLDGHPSPGALTTLRRRRRRRRRARLRPRMERVA